MADVEINAIRAMLASRPRSTELSERRRRLDALGQQYPLPADVRVEAVEANESMQTAGGDQAAAAVSSWSSFAGRKP